MPDDFISINGQDGAGHSVRLTIRIDDNTWMGLEPGGTSNVFVIHKGVWMMAVNIVTLFADDATTRVGQLRPLVPATAAPGDTGQGNSFQTAVDFAWQVLARDRERDYK